MRTIIYQLIVLTTAAISLFGCAGISADTGLQNSTPGNTLEIKLLKEIARVSSKEDLQTIFDTMWENNKDFRSMLDNPDKKEEFIPSLALTYYLLSSSKGASWQNQTSNRLYLDVLENLKPHQLSGQTQYYYTLGLLNSGKFKTAISWLEQLEKTQPASIYIKTLQKAFIMSANDKDIETTLQLLTMICNKKAQDNTIKIDITKIDFIMISMIKKGYIVVLKKRIAPVINRYPQLKELSFIKRVIEYSIGKNTISKFSKPGIWIKVQVIKADNTSKFIDPDLASAYLELQKTLNYSSLKLMDSKVFHLTTNDKTQIKIYPNTNAVFTTLKIENKTSRLKIIITKRQKEIFNTIIESIDKGITTIGGPQTKNGAILLRMTTYNEYFF